MNALQIVNSLYEFIRNALGNIVLFGVAIALIGGIVEKIHLSGKSKKAEVLNETYRKKSLPSVSAQNDETSESKAKSSDTKDRKRIVLITGASSGLGAELARDLDSRNDFDEFFLVARRVNKLEELAKELKHKANCIPLDLSLDTSYEELEKNLINDNADIRFVIASAGFGKIGNYNLVSREESAKMIDLNCRALTETVQTALPFMTEGSRIMLIASTSAFQPFQHLNVYASTKAYVYSYGRALRMELLPRRISVTTVCPYWMKDTEFIGVAEKTEEGTEKKAIRSYALGVNSKKVARRAIRTSLNRNAVSTPGFVCTIHRIFGKLFPKETLMYCWELLRR